MQPEFLMLLRCPSYGGDRDHRAAHASRYAGISDDEVFARAQDDGQAIVTRESQFAGLSAPLRHVITCGHADHLYSRWYAGD